MRQTLLLLPVLLNCAHAANQANKPATAPSAQPSSNCAIDDEGMRELLAGVALEYGDCTMELARQKYLNDRAEDFAHAEQKRADEASARAVWLPVVTSVFSAAIAAAVTAGIDAAKHREPPKMP